MPHGWLPLVLAYLWHDSGAARTTCIQVSFTLQKYSFTLPEPPRNFPLFSVSSLMLLSEILLLLINHTLSLFNFLQSTFQIGSKLDRIRLSSLWLAWLIHICSVL